MEQDWLDFLRPVVRKSAVRIEEDLDILATIKIPAEETRIAFILGLIPHFRYSKFVGKHRVYRFNAAVYSRMKGFFIAFKHPKFVGYYGFTLRHDGILHALLYQLFNQPSNMDGNRFTPPDEQEFYDQTRERWMIPIASFMDIEDDMDTDIQIHRIQEEIEERIICYLAGDRTGWVKYPPKVRRDPDEEEESEEY